MTVEISVCHFRLLSRYHTTMYLLKKVAVYRIDRRKLNNE